MELLEQVVTAAWKEGEEGENSGVMFELKISVDPSLEWVKSNFSYLDIKLK